MSTRSAACYRPAVRAPRPSSPGPTARGAALLAALVLGTSSCGRTDFFAWPRSSPAGPACGDGLLEDGEACEDGNREDTDGCRADCTPARCGDGVVFEGAEVCDDGNAISGDGCEPSCARPRCGDGLTQGPAETCDDANGDDGDACLSSCLLAFCGDGRVQRGVEACDDANTLDHDACVDCQLARCGDGFLQRGVEACDDGNRDDLDGCTNTCRRPVCGDGVVSEGEACDRGDGNADRPALTVIQGGVARPLQPFLGARDVADFYGYRSASSHLGFERAREGRILLYLDRAVGGLFLVMSYGADMPADQPEAVVRVRIEGVPGEASVIVADDRDDELSGGGGTFVGDFHFEGNTDGGVIGPLPYPASWRITLTHTTLDGIGRLAVIDHDGASLALDADDPLVLESTLIPSACRTDCRGPTCGDGQLDPGELCDSPDPLCGPTCGQ